MECFESLARLQQQNRCLAPGNGCPLDLPSELLYAGTLQIINRIGTGLGQQAERSIKRARVQVREGGGQRSVGAPTRVGGQGERPLEEGRRGRQPGASLGLDRRLLRARWPRLRQVLWPRQPGATPGDQDRSGRPSPQPASGGRRGNPPGTRPCRRLTAPEGAGTVLGSRSAAAVPHPPRPPHHVPGPTSVRHATAAWRPRWGRPPPAASARRVGCGSARTWRR